MAKRTRKRTYPKTAGKNRDLWLYLLILLLCGTILWIVTRKPESGGTATVEHSLKTAGFDPDSLVSALERKFDLPQGKISRKKNRGVLQLDLPVERRKMDLTFANMIVKGEFEARGAVLSSGKVEGNRQALTFTHGEDEYAVDLFYGALSPQDRSSKRFLAIVVDDFGTVGDELLQQWLELPVQINFSIFSGMKYSEETMNRAHAQGRETLVHVPMEPIDYPRENPGDNPILVQMDQARVEKTLLRHLNALPLCAGINNHMGSLATTDNTIMGWVMGVLKKKGRFFLDSRTSNVSIAFQTAQKARIPAFRNDLFLDSPDISDATLEARISQVRELGQHRNAVVAITHCHNAEKLQYLKAFIDKAMAAGFTLIPLSQVGKTDVPLIL